MRALLCFEVATDRPPDPFMDVLSAVENIRIRLRRMLAVNAFDLKLVLDSMPNANGLIDPRSVL